VVGDRAVAGDVVRRRLDADDRRAIDQDRRAPVEEPLAVEGVGRSDRVHPSIEA
jgi:hypothetical protein